MQAYQLIGFVIKIDGGTGPTILTTRYMTRRRLLFTMYACMYIVIRLCLSANGDSIINGIIAVTAAAGSY